MSLNRRIQKLEKAVQPDTPEALYAVASMEDYWRLQRTFHSGLSRYVWEAGDEPQEGETLEAAAARNEARQAARLADTTLPVEERYTYSEAVRAGVIVETPAFHAEYARERERWAAGESFRHFPPRSFAHLMGEPITPPESSIPT